MSKSNSQSKNTTSTATSLTTKNLNVSGNSGPSAVAEGGSSQSLTVNNNVTDLGAVKAATGLSSHALDINAAVTQKSLDTVANFASKSFSSVNSAYGAALTAVTDNADNTVTVVERLADKFGTALADLTGSEQTQLGNVVSALNSTYQSNNTSANTQVLDAAQGNLKIIAVAAVAALALFVLLKK